MASAFWNFRTCQGTSAAAIQLKFVSQGLVITDTETLKLATETITKLKFKLKLQIFLCSQLTEPPKYRNILQGRCPPAVNYLHGLSPAASSLA